ncbi:MAG: hypothetical protein JW734_09830, partial [Candidatus Omnitrophica bacterium]|nr:hypothetical protein [Candidatus Omnitrophota bacterium]
SGNIQSSLWPSEFLPRPPSVTFFNESIGCEIHPTGKGKCAQTAPLPAAYLPCVFLLQSLMPKGLT